MTKKAKVIEAERMETAKALEAGEDYMQAIKAYRTILSRNPVHIAAATRLLVLLRKSKDLNAEIKLLKELIRSKKEDLKTRHQNWVTKHREISEASKPLAHMLGLLDAKGQPEQADEQTIKWQARQLALEKRLKKQADKPLSKAGSKKKPEQTPKNAAPAKTKPRTTKPAKKTEPKTP
jgi:tetratricopeptide (TPR) repeat protein